MQMDIKSIMKSNGKTGKKAHAKTVSFDVMAFIRSKIKTPKPTSLSADQVVYSQGDSADSVFYVHKGKVKVSVTSARGKEAVVAIRGPDEFCGEGALTGKPYRLASVSCITPCEIVRINKGSMANLLHSEANFADYFLAHLLTRTVRIEADLVDQLFNSSELRLARALLLLANYGKAVDPDPVPIHVNQETLADLIGTTRSRVNFFMNKFRKLGLINYNGKLEVHQALLNFVLLQQPHITVD
jgi:CRP/FNR family transcriptional regulator, cyclic AMP receptor protein